MAALRACGQLCLVALTALSVGATACAVNSDPPLTAAQQMELDTLRNQLADPARTAKTKREAALLLLSRPYSQADDALKQFLEDDANRAAQAAIAEVIAQTGMTRKEFADPLLKLLVGPEPSLRTAAANALAAFKDNAVLERLISLAGDRQADRSARLATIAAMQRILDKRTVNALIGLLDDGDEAISNGACDALAKLTNIRAFGRDPNRWRTWWAQNSSKRSSDWVADLAESLARANLQLERDNTELRRRLSESLNELYALTPAAERDALLTRMLKDPLEDVRLAGIQLAQQRLTGPPEAPEALRTAVRAAVKDASPAVRRVAAVLVAGIDNGQAAELLAEGLRIEQRPEVREAIYQGLGLLRDTSVWSLLVAGIGERDRAVGAAAAAALVRVAERNPVPDDLRDDAVKALTSRYEAAAGPDLAPLREALLAAMGALNDKRLEPLLVSALSDAAATVRLSAVKGLRRLGAASNAAAIVPLAADSDRGVRLAAIAAIGALGGVEHLDAVLARTRESDEPDVTVRQQAWSAATSLLALADVARLASLADQLAAQDNARQHLIELLKLWAGKVSRKDIDQWLPVRLRLCQALMAENRPSEAAGELAAAHAALVGAADERADAVRLQWIESLLAAGDVSAVARIAEITDDQQFAGAVSALLARLGAAADDSDPSGAVRLALAAQTQLAARLDDVQKKALADALAKARQRQQQFDRQQVAGLVARLAGADEAARAAAKKDLIAMNGRAVRPLVEELKSAIAGGATSGAAAEKAIIEVLSTIAPQLTGYDPAAAQAVRLGVADGWLATLGS